ncbi:Holliday junction resolvase RecU [Anaerospora hongkongensis]|uniref:Holliday junction resolvase RecU n=1 Tax=Anaerospora hongkongensis TaxID=244830 RepID=UPI0028A1C47F|nr:Holliday junction resolvase RecU [Anaerospora hongkongensis]
MAKTHANRGRSLEELITYANGLYRAEKIAIVDKVPTEWIPQRGNSGKIVGAKVTKKSIVDFTGHWQGKPIAFDAKHTLANSIRWDVLETHQAEFLSDWYLTGGISFILVSFSMQHFFAVPWHFWKNGLDYWLDYGKNPTLSINVIPVNWQIPLGSRFVLDYLSVVKSI